MEIERAPPRAVTALPGFDPGIGRAIHEYSVFRATADLAARALSRGWPAFAGHDEIVPAKSVAVVAFDSHCRLPPRLGTWQGIYLFEHRRSPHQREVVLHLIGE